MIDAHQAYLKETDRFELHRRRRYEAELVEIIRKRLMNLIFDESVFKERIEELIERIYVKETDPYSAAEEILTTVLK